MTFFHYTKKIIALSLIFSLSVIGFPWQDVLAYFNDTETSAQNTITLASLDFSLSSADDFRPLVTPTQPTSREISVVNEGSLGFQYKISAVNFSGSLCGHLNLTADLDGQFYSGPLTAFSDQAVGSFTVPDDWNFSLTLDSDDFSLQNQSCTFDFAYTAWQENLPDETAGFSDVETISNTVQSGSWNGVVLNEILPNPEGDDDQVGLQGEWVEFYNNGDQAVDLDGWYIEDASSSGHRQTISSQTTFNGRTTIGVPGSGLEWVVLFMDGNILNNTGDTVTLYTPDGQAVDSYSFTASNNDDDSDSNNTPGGDNQNPTGNETAGNEGKSYARIPDGTGDWVDPVPTPGGPNELTLSDDTTGEQTDETTTDDSAQDTENSAPALDNNQDNPTTDNQPADTEQTGETDNETGASGDTTVTTPGAPTETGDSTNQTNIGADEDNSDNNSSTADTTAHDSDETASGTDNSTEADTTVAQDQAPTDSDSTSANAEDNVDNSHLDNPSGDANLDGQSVSTDDSSQAVEPEQPAANQDENSADTAPVANDDSALSAEETSSENLQADGQTIITVTDDNSSEPQVEDGSPDNGGE